MIKNISFKEFSDIVINQRKKDFFINILFYGNIYIDHLKVIQQKLTNFLPKLLKNSLDLKDFNKIYKIPGSNIYRAKNDFKEEMNNLIANIYEIQEMDYKMNVITSLLDIIFGNTFYYELRTVKQLGYIVRSTKTIRSNMMVFLLINKVLLSFGARNKRKS